MLDKGTWTLWVVPSGFGWVFGGVAALVGLIGAVAAAATGASLGRTIGLACLSGLVVGIPAGVAWANGIGASRLRSREVRERGGAPAWVMVPGMGSRMLVAFSLAVAGLGVAKWAFEGRPSAVRLPMLAAVLIAAVCGLAYRFARRTQEREGWRW